MGQDLIFLSVSKLEAFMKCGMTTEDVLFIPEPELRKPPYITCSKSIDKRSAMRTFYDSVARTVLFHPRKTFDSINTSQRSRKI